MVLLTTCVQQELLHWDGEKVVRSDMAGFQDRTWTDGMSYIVSYISSYKKVFFNIA